MPPVPQPRHYVSTPSTNATSVKAGPGTLTMLACGNNNAAVRFVKLYDTPDRPNVGQDTPALTLIVPGGATGAGFVLPLGPDGIGFTYGIAFAMTTGMADSDTGAVGLNDLVLSLAFR